MLNTALLKELGGWDPVRTSADRELIQRLAAKLGSPSVRLVDKEIPLCFALDQKTSLTRTPETHVRSVFFGTINAYQSASRRWHASARQAGDFRIDPDPNAPRKFPAPVTMLSERIAPRPYDVTLIADFGLADEAFELAYEHLVAALRCGLRVAIFHWPRYDNAPSDVDSRIHTLIDQLKIDLLMPEQTLETSHLVVYAPAILQHRLDQVPRIAAERMHVVVDQTVEGDGRGAGAQYDPEIVRQNLEALFGSEGEWCPISPLIHDRMAADPRYPEPGGLTWMPWAR